MPGKPTYQEPSRYPPFFQRSVAAASDGAISGSPAIGVSHFFTRMAWRKTSLEYRPAELLRQFYLPKQILAARLLYMGENDI